MTAAAFPSPFRGGWLAARAGWGRRGSAGRPFPTNAVQGESTPPDRASPGHPPLEGEGDWSLS